MSGVQKVAQTWQAELGINIVEQEWDVIWGSVKKMSVCNRVRLQQYKILHRLQISPNRRHNMNPQLSPMCLKCKITVGTYTHCIWSCYKIQAYWADVLQDMQDILGVDLHMNPLSLLLGHPIQGATITASNHRLYDILAFVARKNIYSCPG